MMATLKRISWEKDWAVAAYFGYIKNVHGGWKVVVAVVTALFIDCIIFDICAHLVAFATACTIDIVSLVARRQWCMSIFKAAICLSHNNVTGRVVVQHAILQSRVHFETSECALTNIFQHDKIRSNEHVKCSTTNDAVDKSSKMANDVPTSQTTIHWLMHDKSGEMSAHFHTSLICSI